MGFQSNEVLQIDIGSHARNADGHVVMIILLTSDRHLWIYLQPYTDLSTTRKTDMISPVHFHRT